MAPRTYAQVVSSNERTRLLPPDDATSPSVAAHPDEGELVLDGANEAVADPTAASNGSSVTIKASSSATEASPPIEDSLEGLQIFLLAATRVADPLSFFAIFSYVNQQIFDTGDVAATDVGFYSGLVESLFSLCQVLVMIPWGRLSDRYGRKPCLVVSCFGLAIAQLVYGFSTDIRSIIIARCFAGLFAGSVVTIRTMFSELSNPTNAARAFSYFAVAGNVGIFLGPLVGGVLSRPALQYPSLFGKNRLFLSYPYALPCLFTASYITLCALLVVFFVKETRVAPTEADKAKPAVDTSLRAVFSIPGVPFVLFVSAWTVMLGFAYVAILPVFQFTPIKYGGLGFDPRTISVFFALGGASQTLWLLLAFPPLQRRWGTLTVSRRASYGYAPSYICAIIGSVVYRNGAPLPLLYTYMVIVAIICGALGMPFLACSMSINHISPSPAVLGTLNGIQLTIVSITRTVSPAAFASIYAYGVKHQIVYGYLGWLVLTAVAVGLPWAMYWMPAAADSKPVADTEPAP